MLCFDISDQRAPRALTLHFPSSLALSCQHWLMKSLWPSAGFSEPGFAPSCVQLPVCHSVMLSHFLWVPSHFLSLRGNIFLCVTSAFLLAFAEGDASPLLPLFPLISSLVSVEGDVSFYVLFQVTELDVFFCSFNIPQTILLHAPSALSHAWWQTLKKRVEDSVVSRTLRVTESTLKHVHVLLY